MCSCGQETLSRHSWCSYCLPMMYEKHEDKVDPVAEKAMKELKKHYMVFSEKVLFRIPLSSVKEKIVKLGK
ncbi:unnamed protein product [Eruca vesicaria subsp. sativa]|uniref:Uncharacterized protein n=1 Tax=Eruca vesicaria subsp. sativa TaxID=29727 RepID=A0ABC8M0E6_ERUVS|nr:unnamed protein product [Eruca vesicaria subsp. sativa]